MLCVILRNSVVLKYYFKFSAFTAFSIYIVLNMSNTFGTSTILSEFVEYGQNLQCVLQSSGNKL